MTTHPPTSAMLAHSTRFWDKTARKYAAATIADMAGYEHTLQRVRQRLRPTDRVLELGCGTATTALRLAPATAHYTAADLSPAMVDIARRKLKNAPLDVHRMLQLVVADADAHLPAPAPAPVGWQGTCLTETASQTAEGWDTVLAFNLLHLVPDVNHTLAQVRRHLRPGGLFISKTPCVGQMNPLVPHVALPVLRLLKVIPPIHVLTEDQLMAAIERCGLTIESVEHHATSRWSRDWRPYVVARKPAA